MWKLHGSTLIPPASFNSTGPPIMYHVFYGKYDWCENCTITTKYYTFIFTINQNTIKI